MEKLWDAIAYAARYGKQPLNVLMAMTPEDINTFNHCISEMVREEGKPRD